jgi:hypothetical protein
LELAVVTACNPTGEGPIVSVDTSYNKWQGRKYEFVAGLQHLDRPGVKFDFPFVQPSRVTAFLPVAVTKDDGETRWYPAFEEELDQSFDNVNSRAVSEDRNLITVESSASIETLVQWKEETEVFLFQGTYKYSTVDGDHNYFPVAGTYQGTYVSPVMSTLEVGVPIPDCVDGFLETPDGRNFCDLLAANGISDCGELAEYDYSQENIDLVESVCVASCGICTAGACSDPLPPSSLLLQHQ